MRRPDPIRGLVLAGVLLAGFGWAVAANAQEGAPAAPAPAAAPPATPATVPATPPPATPSATAAKTRLETRAGIHPGFARLVFAGVGGAAAVPFKATSTDDALTIRFDRPVEASLDPFRRALGAYVDQVAATPDGLTVTAHLKRPIAIQQAAYDAATLVVDLVDKPKTAEATPPKPAPATEPAKPEPAAAAAKPAEAAAATKPAAPEQKPPAAEAKPGAKPAAVPEAKPLKVGVRIGSRGPADRIVLEWPKPVGDTLTQGDGKVQVAFDQPAAIDMAHLRRILPKRLAPGSLSADGIQLDFTLPPGHRVNETHDRNLTILDVVPGTPPAVAPPTPPPPPPPAPPPPVAAAPPAEPAPVVHPPTPPADADQDAPTATGQVSGTLGSAAENDLQIRYTLIDDGVSLRFEWRQPTAAAIFRRGNAVWMVFDRAQKMDFSDFRAANWPVLTAITEVPSRAGTVLRLSVWAGFNPSVRRAGTAWIVDLRNQPQRSDSPVQGQVRSDGPNASMIFPVSDPASPISLVDPDAGDVLVAVPLPQLGQGSDLGADYPDFRLLPSAQGLVFRPASDQLAIRSQPSLVELSAPGGLALSSDADRHAERTEKGEKNRVFNPVDWLGNPAESFTQRRQELTLAITTASPDDKNNARIDLARFFFASGMGVEALSVLRAIEHDAPGMFDDPNLRALRGAAEEMANQLDTASSDLGDPSLDDRVDGQLWRAVLAADHGQWTDALNAYAKSDNVLKNYPEGLRNTLSIKLAEALLNAGERDKAAALAADAMAHHPTDDESDRAKVLQGRILAIQGDSKQAVDLWGQVAKSPDSSLARAQAVYAMTLTQLENKQIERTDAIAALDRLRFVWRGDDFEVRVLRKLAELQIEDGNYRDGFRSLRQVLASYGDNPVSKGVADEMQQYFIDLFLGKASDSVSPLKQLGLYEEFKELTPPGAVGDEIIRKLADQLVKVDLLDRAGDLLDNQVKTRLAGLDQARVATQLALVRLLDRRPDDAIAALDIPVPPDLPPELVNQRLELRARALAEQDKNPDALKLLTDDQSDDANRLRVDIYWKTQNWAAVVPVLKHNLKPPAAGKVDEDTARTVLKIATAMVLGKDRAGLVALQKQYGAAMDQSPLKDDFRVVAGNSSSTAGDFKSLADRVAQISDLQGFMTTYRQRLAKDQLSKIN
jgi:tetratricopeptide (TPR) repeat protein